MGPLEALVSDKKNDVNILRAKGYKAKACFSIDKEFENNVKISDKLILVGYSLSKGQLYLTEGSFQGYSQYQKQFMMIKGIRVRPGHSGSPVLSKNRNLVGMILGGYNTCDEPLISSEQDKPLGKQIFTTRKCDDFALFVSVDRIRDVWNTQSP